MLSVDFESSIEPLNGGLFISPGFGIHETRVLDSYEIIFVTHGVLELFEDDRVFEIRENQTLLLCPGHKHGGYKPYPPLLNFYWIHFKKRENSHGDASITLPKLATIRDREYVMELFSLFISDQESFGPSEFCLSQILTLILCEIADAAEGELELKNGSPQAAPSAKLLERIQGAIQKNYKKPVGSSELARELGISRDYMERVFRKNCKKSIVDALNEKRVLDARILLRSEGRKNISEIAFACGFNDPHYFRRVFKRFTGLSPTQFRSMDGKKHINTH